MTVPVLRALCSTLTEQSAQKLLDFSRGIDHSLPQVGFLRISLQILLPVCMCAVRRQRSL